MAPNTSHDHPDDLNIRQWWTDITTPFPPYRGPQAQPHRKGYNHYTCNIIHQNLKMLFIACHYLFKINNRPMHLHFIICNNIPMHSNVTYIKFPTYTTIICVCVFILVDSKSCSPVIRSPGSMEALHGFLKPRAYSSGIASVSFRNGLSAGIPYSRSPVRVSTSILRTLPKKLVLPN